ncbi:oxygenase MpaB family protein [Frateuria defendens]|uniref:oxygenase MpaB family protein n=1 Tax=Frateuria defendens TaxID=2219559 RepID=UPI00066FF116|nr:oxygenase MpaB family protein [Frateuria defendens]
MPPPFVDLLARPAVRAVRRWVLGAFPREHGLADYDAPAGDAGLFGPDSVTWRIHADFPGMLAGGLAALMLQTLHPLALAGVWDHSNFREDLVGRLRRTTRFVGATTYAPQAMAQALIGHVKAIHAQVHGVAEDGRPYRADDPALLTWVHVTEAYSFLQGFRRYSHRAVPEAIADRYYDEARRVAEALGARGVPRSQAEVAAYFRRVQPQLRYDHRSREVLGVLTTVRLPVPAAGLSRDLFLHAGAALLPDWASERLERTPAQRRQDRLAARTLWLLAPAFRAALRDGLVAHACRRMGVAPERMLRWPA